MKSDLTGSFNQTASITDPMLGDGGTSTLTSNIGSGGIDAAGSLSSVGPHDEGTAGARVDVTFSLSTAFAFKLKYGINGNSFSFELKRLDNGGSEIIAPMGPNVNNSSIRNYGLTKNGTLVAGKYELIFNADNNSGNSFYYTDSYTLHLGLTAL